MWKYFGVAEIEIGYFLSGDISFWLDSLSVYFFVSFVQLFSGSTPNDWMHSTNQFSKRRKYAFTIFDCV